MPKNAKLRVRFSYSHFPSKRENILNVCPENVRGRVSGRVVETEGRNLPP